MTDVRAMCAIGKRGQLGLNGTLPWEGEKGQEYVADVQRFFDLTRGHVVIVFRRLWGLSGHRSLPAARSPPAWHLHQLGRFDLEHGRELPNDF